MHRWHRITRVVLTLMAVAFLASVSVTAAQAGNGHGRGYGNVRYKGGYHKKARWHRAPVVIQRVVYAPRPVFVRPAYGVYRLGRPVSGGFLAAQFGAVSFGFQLANRPYGYVYEDPYCHARFASLSAYRDHCGAHRHEVVVRVIHENGGDADRGYHDQGGWQGEDRSYDDRGYQDDQYHDDREWDRGQDENWDEEGYDDGR